MVEPAAVQRSMVVDLSVGLNTYHREMIVWLSGPTGAGKTSIAHLLGASGHSVVAEYAPKDLFQAFACHPTTGCEPLQRYLMQARADAWRKTMGMPSIVFDRS